MLLGGVTGFSLICHELNGDSLRKSAGHLTGALILMFYQVMLAVDFIANWQRGFLEGSDEENNRVSVPEDLYFILELPPPSSANA